MASHCHAAFDVTEPSRVGEVRRHAVRLAESFGFDEVAAGRVALVVNELGNNLVRHAQGAGCSWGPSRTMTGACRWR